MNLDQEVLQLRQREKDLIRKLDEHRTSHGDLAEELDHLRNSQSHNQARIDNLVMLVKRMARRLKKHSQNVGDEQLANQAEQYLQAGGFISVMDILREDDHS